MNISNLQRMIDLLKTVDQSRFNMEVYYTNMIGLRHEAFDKLKSRNYECDTAGCVVGHCIVLDKELFNSLESLATSNSSLSTIYSMWSEKFTGLKMLSLEWEWCFGSDWKYTDNSITGAIDRMQAMINGTYREHPMYETFLDYVYQH